MKQPAKTSDVYLRIRQILESARLAAARSVNTAQVVANWLIGREIVEEEQRGKSKAIYGARLLEELSARLNEEFVGGYSVDNLELFRRFYLEYPVLISDTPRRKLSQATEPSGSIIGYALRSESWQPGQLNPNLSWTH